MISEDYMRRAISLASENVREKGGGPFGAIIVKEGTIIGTGVNTVTTDNDPTAHAEVNAIREACSKLGSFDLHGCTLYTSCEPCPMCLSAAYWAKVDKIYFAADKVDAKEAGFSDAFIYEEIPLPYSERSLQTERLLGEEGKEPFELWRGSDDKIPY